VKRRHVVRDGVCEGSGVERSGIWRIQVTGGRKEADAPRVVTRMGEPGLSNEWRARATSGTMVGWLEGKRIEMRSWECK